MSRLRLEELRALDAANGHPERAAVQPIPTLAEGLAFLERHPGLGAALEVKARGIGDRVAAAVQRSAARRHLAISSFIPRELAAVKAVDRSIPCLLLLHKGYPPVDPVKTARRWGIDALDIPHRWLDRGVVTAMHRAGLLVSAGMAKDPKTVAWLVALDADAVDSDRPAAIVAVRDRCDHGARDRRTEPPITPARRIGDARSGIPR